MEEGGEFLVLLLIAAIAFFATASIFTLAVAVALAVGGVLLPGFLFGFGRGLRAGWTRESTE